MGGPHFALFGVDEKCRANPRQQWLFMVPGNWHPVTSFWERSSKLCYVCLFFPPTPSCPGAAQALSDIFPFASGEPFNSLVFPLLHSFIKHLVSIDFGAPTLSLRVELLVF